MRAHRRLLLVVSVVIALIVGSCAPPTTEPTVEPTQPPAEPTVEPTQVPAEPTGEPIKIGQIAPLTGSAALDGQLVSHGADMAVAEINAAGGVLGRPLELIVEDGKADPTESVNAAEKLLTRDKVDVLVGCWASSATLAVIPVVEEYQVPFVVEISTNPLITQQGVPWVFRTSSNEELNSQFLGGTAVNKLGFSKIAYLAVNNDWGRGAAENYTKIIEGAGGEVILTEYSDATEVNFYAILNRVAASGADSMIVTHSLSTMANIFRQMRELELDIPVLLTGGYTIEAMTEAAGGDFAIYEGIYSLGYTVPAGIGVMDNVTAFIDKYMETYPEDPIARGSANGYDAIYVIAEAMRIAGSTEPAAVRDALTQVSYEGIGGLIEFDDENQAHPQLYLLQVQGDKLVIVNFD